MANIVAAFFRTRAEGEAARNKLLAGGFTPGEVSVLAGDARGAGLAGGQSEPAPEAYLTDVIGIAVEAMALLVPGAGPLVAAGPLAGAIRQMKTGAASGGIAGILRDHGISEQQAAHYAEGIGRGGALVTVHDVTEEAQNKARAILEQSGAIESEELPAENSR